MCTVSMVIKDWQHPTWPQPIMPNPPLQPGPNSIPWPLIQQDPKLAEQMLEVLKRLEAIDKRLDKMEQCKVAEPAKKKLRKQLREIARRAK